MVLFDLMTDSWGEDPEEEESAAAASAVAPDIDTVDPPAEADPYAAPTEGHDAEAPIVNSRAAAIAAIKRQIEDLKKLGAIQCVYFWI